MSIENVRQILYEILIADDDKKQDRLVPEIVANQQLGVSVSSAMAKNGGVKIFQLQNVVQKKVIGHVVNALKELDEMTLLPIMEVPVIEKVPEPDWGLAYDQKINDALDKETPALVLLKEVEKDYVATAIERYEDQPLSEVAKRLHISYSKLMQIRRKINS